VPVVGVGDGVQRYADVLGAVPGVTCLLHTLSAPPPMTLLGMALERHATGTEPSAPELIVPLYMREADAKSNFTQVPAR